MIISHFFGGLCFRHFFKLHWSYFPSSVRSWYSNPRPLECESTALTTSPQLLTLVKLFIRFFKIYIILIYIFVKRVYVIIPLLTVIVIWIFQHSVLFGTILSACTTMFQSTLEKNPWAIKAIKSERWGWKSFLMMLYDLPEKKDLFKWW